MFRLDHHSDAVGPKELHQGICDLNGKILLNLQSSSKDVDDPSYFGKPDYFSVWDIGDMTLLIKAEYSVEISLSSKERMLRNPITSS